MPSASRKPTKILRERDVENYLKARVQAAGGEIRKVKWIGRNSAPDRLVMVHDRAVWVELKRPNEVATPAQQREHIRMRKYRLSVEVFSDFTDIDGFMHDLKTEEEQVRLKKPIPVPNPW